MNDIHLSLKQVATMLRIAPYKIQYAIVNGRVQEPRLRIANNRVFEAADVLRLAEYFRRPIPEEVVADISPTPGPVLGKVSVALGAGRLNELTESETRTGGSISGEY